METFVAARDFVANPRFAEQRRRALVGLDIATIDAPIAGLVQDFRRLPYCFTLQSCYGHFLCSSEQDRRTLEPVFQGVAGLVKYRIAYLALCLENSPAGWALRDRLAEVPAVDPHYVQFGSADWFRQQRPNVYVLQVGPSAHRFKDEMLLTPAEAVHTQRTRHLFFEQIRTLLSAEPHEK